jgi:hypothetical protein
MTIKDYKALPSGVKCIVSVMHTNQHYVVMEITIDTGALCKPKKCSPEINFG